MGLLLFVAIAGIGLAATGMTWHSKIKVENEQQLLFVGSQYRNALNSYYESTPSGAKTYPFSLQDLLLDKRFPNVKRHIRKIYPDPMTGKAEWGINRTQGRIVGIYSLSNQKPFKLAGFTSENQSFNYAKSYRQWLFGQVSTDQTSRDPASKDTVATGIKPAKK